MASARLPARLSAAPPPPLPTSLPVIAWMACFHHGWPSAAGILGSCAVPKPDGVVATAVVGAPAGPVTDAIGPVVPPSAGTMDVGGRVDGNDEAVMKGAPAPGADNPPTESGAAAGVPLNQSPPPAGAGAGSPGGAPEGIPVAAPVESSGA